MHKSSNTKRRRKAQDAVLTLSRITPLKIQNSVMLRLMRQTASLHRRCPPWADGVAGTLQPGGGGWLGSLGAGPEPALTLACLSLSKSSLCLSSSCSRVTRTRASRLHAWRTAAHRHAVHTAHTAVTAHVHSRSIMTPAVLS